MRRPDGQLRMRRHGVNVNFTTVTFFPLLPCHRVTIRVGFFFSDPPTVPKKTENFHHPSIQVCVILVVVFFGFFFHLAGLWKRDGKSWDQTIT